MPVSKCTPPLPKFWQRPGHRTQPLTHRQVTTIGSLPLYSRSVSCHSSNITEAEGGSISSLFHPFKCKMCMSLSCILTCNKQVVKWFQILVAITMKATFLCLTREKRHIIRGSYRKSWATIFCKVTCFIIDKPNTPP